MKNVNMSRLGFTLIELLVVVLIIGILASVAVPQYQKAVIKSKAAQMQTLLDAVVKASDLYYLQNGEYPQNFDDLDIGIELPTLDYRPCLDDLGKFSIKHNGDMAIAIYSGAPSFQINVITAYFTTGKYKCRGFTRIQKWKTDPHDDGTYCMEARYQLDCGTNCENGIFCTNVMGKTSRGGAAGGQMTLYD